MDYGKFKYEAALKARESRKNQTQTIVKEIKLRPKIDPHDYGTKKGHVERFLKAGDKVKVTIMFRGREQSRPELGFRLLQKLADDVQELGFVESQAKQDGRNMIMVIGPHRKPVTRAASSGRTATTVTRRRRRRRSRARCRARGLRHRRRARPRPPRGPQSRPRRRRTHRALPRLTGRGRSGQACAMAGPHNLKLPASGEQFDRRRRLCRR